MFVASAAAFLVATGGNARPAGPLSVDVALVLAVDVSASMEPEEFQLQRSGYVEAIRHADFVRAVLDGANGRVALTYVEWSGPELQRVVVPWRLIDGAVGARAFADALARQGILQSQSTSISAALDFGADLLDHAPFAADRRVIDISGDGPNNAGRPVTAARDDALARGIAINGLPILISPSPTFPAMDRYYRDCVIGGPGAFILPIHAADEFAIAIHRKLILEVAGAPTAGAVVPVAAEQPVDCLVGERARDRLAPYYPQLDR